MKAIEQWIGCAFQTPALLENALTHSSYANETHTKSNERLEFLGDAVLQLVVSRYLYKRFPKAPEGELTRLRAQLVCEKALCSYANEIGIGQDLLLGKGEEQSGGRERPSILADAFEAVLAAVYLDCGWDVAERYVVQLVSDQIAQTGGKTRDYKTELQEIVQKNAEEKVTYVLVDERGPDHDKHFTVEVHLNSNVIGRGEAHSKKAAEQLAAREALELMGE